MLSALLLAASLLPMQVAVEGDSELSATVVLRLLDEGHRVVPSADDAMTTLSVQRAEGGDVVVLAVGRRTASERVLSTTMAPVRTGAPTRRAMRKADTPERCRVLKRVSPARHRDYADDRGS